MCVRGRDRERDRQRTEGETGGERERQINRHRSTKVSHQYKQNETLTNITTKYR